MRRSLFLFLVVALAAFGVYRWLQLDRRLREVHRPEQYTPADGPRIDPKDVQVLSALDAEYTRLVQTVIPSVVSITTSRRSPAAAPEVVNPLESLFRDRQPTTSLGSGVIVSLEGHIITNRHVVANMETIEVQLTDGRVLPAQLIGSDEQTDIAVLKVNADKVEPLSLGDSDEVRVGQMVFAVGNPFGLHETVTQGIISARDRRSADSGVEFLQTDAAINQGNSGGPLLNLKGEIIGINSSIAASKVGTWTGISFAIPSNVARRALESVLKTGRIVHGYLGVHMLNLSDVPPEFTHRLGLSDTEGTIVADVLPDSPAEKAGLKPGDVIRRFNGRPVLDIFFLRSRVAEMEIKTKAQLTILRDGQEQTLTVEIVEAPPDLEKRTPQPPR